MRIAALVSPIGSLILAGAAIGALAVAHVRNAPPAAVHVTVYVPEPVVTYVKTVPSGHEYCDPDVPGNATYWSIDLDGDGAPEMVALTRDHSQAVVTNQATGLRVAEIPLQFEGNGCASDLGIENGHLVAHDRAGENCTEVAVRRFSLRDGQLATVTITDTVSVDF
jgi:hypothetical protein